MSGFDGFARGESQVRVGARATYSDYPTQSIEYISLVPTIYQLPDLRSIKWSAARPYASGGGGGVERELSSCVSGVSRMPMISNGRTGGEWPACLPLSRRDDMRDIDSILTLALLLDLVPGFWKLRRAKPWRVSCAVRNARVRASLICRGR